jgi:hypothetical protein
MYRHDHAVTVVARRRRVSGAVAPTDLRFPRVPLAQNHIAGVLRPRLSAAWSFCSRIKRFAGALGIIGAVLAALYWVVLVGLLVQEWVNWWAELETYMRTSAYPLTWGSYGVLE